MIKVVIADDEVRVCQLIYALVDWAALGMEVAGMAHNGLEAIEMVDKLRPDILITDIRMPGCSGLEMISQVKEREASPEIIIISGYAHFEYAQQALKYGVGDYLLKPVNKGELNATLRKLQERICDRRESERDRAELVRKSEKDEDLLRRSLAGALMKQEGLKLSMQNLRDTYHLRVEPGIFQAFWVKMDCGREEMSQPSASIVMGKVRELLELGLLGKCFELVLEIRGFVCAGFLNYPQGRQEDIRRALKSCVSQMELQKNLFRPVSFTVALGKAGEPEELPESMGEAELLVKERILRGTGRLFERMGPPGALSSSAVLERYLREVTQAVEVLDESLLEEALLHLEEEVRGAKKVRGCEILELVGAAAEVFAVKAQVQDRAGYLERFRQSCDRCGSLEDVFGCLGDLEKNTLRALVEKQESETVRPIRRAKQYMQEHYSEPITQEQVSAAVGLSPTYFSALFKRTEGEGFARYLMGIRMEQAKILLRESNLPVAEICRRVGYNDLKHFSHTFEKVAGVKPAVYRKLYG